MAKVHDKYVIELAEVIKGYGNDPDVADPFRLSEFYRFYELPNIAVSQENFEKMQLLDDVPFGYSQEYINQIKWERDLAIQQLNELGYGLGEEMRTDGDTISRRAAINLIGQHTFYNDYDDMDRCSLVDGLRKLPSAQPEIIRCKDCKHYHISFCKIWSRYGTVQTRETGFCYMAERKDNG